ncbi:GNAT family N-acetyltransferase [Ammoniphilus sp. CFH 90114]|uniref:GNAT family N-acetyltransferase n=1 Tax=Ammoniphilus sp. CFH 90114 TaxID=2493665 RepID=UPI00100E8098|nr:GNAT family N-acetyltransferase [Ammoniphilus sp. CFH 90114]RXT03891.1 N-acetyltransferase family protein [Ammoniphilus sp. CFH 90114]
MMYLIREIQEKDWDQCKVIYEAGIATGHATFEVKSPPYEEWISSAVMGCSLVAYDGDTILGWCKLSRVSDRCVYAGVGEVSVYVHPEAKGKGIGSVLLNGLIKKSEEKGYWTLNAGVFPENEASIQLHKKHDFREVGRRERIGKMNGIWRDVVLLERRSRVVGMD